MARPTPRLRTTTGVTQLPQCRPLAAMIGAMLLLRPYLLLVLRGPRWIAAAPTTSEQLSVLKLVRPRCSAAPRHVASCRQSPRGPCRGVVVVAGRRPLRRRWRGCSTQWADEEKFLRKEAAPSVSPRRRRQKFLSQMWWCRTGQCCGSAGSSGFASRILWVAFCWLPLPASSISLATRTSKVWRSGCSNQAGLVYSRWKYARERGI